MIYALIAVIIALIVVIISMRARQKAMFAEIEAALKNRELKRLVDAAGEVLV